VSTATIQAPTVIPETGHSFISKGSNYYPLLDQQLHQCFITKFDPRQPGDTHTASDIHHR